MSRGIFLFFHFPVQDYNVVFGQIVNMQQHIYNGCLICSFHSDPSISLIYYTRSSPRRSCRSASCAPVAE